MLKYVLLIFTVILFATNGNAKRYRTLYVENHLDFKERWTQIGSSTSESLERLIELLNRSKTGKKIIRLAKNKAFDQGKTLLDVIHQGEGSITDTTLIRKFFPSNPDHVVFEVESYVYIDKNLPVIDAVLDLAHELTHFIYRAPFNPYSERFELADFIKSTIEEKGGEVDAYIAECTVLKELFSTSEYEKSNCPRITTGAGNRFSRYKARKLFYQVGQYFDLVRKGLRELGADNALDFLSELPAVYISSAYDVPYPLAAMKEYVTIVKKVCENDRKRLILMKRKVNRAPSSSTSINERYKKMKKIYLNRCVL